MIEPKNKFFEAAKLPEISLPVSTTSFVSYTDFFPESQINTVSGNTKKRKQYKLKPEYKTTVSQTILNPILHGALDLMDQNPNIRGKYRVTSTVRSARYEGDASNHIKGMAFDIVPVDGDFQKLQQEIAKDANLVNYLQRNNLGIIVEVGPEARQKYKATGDNLHFGPDPAAIAGLSQLINQFKI